MAVTRDDEAARLARQCSTDDSGASDWPGEVDERRAATTPSQQATRTFDHALAKGFIEKLKDERGDWWRDILDDETLVIAPRGQSLDVYWLGARLFHVQFTDRDLRVSTHEKYLLDPALKGQVRMRGGAFDIKALRDRGFISTYTKKQTLTAMKTTARLYAGVEKSGCHEIAVKNSSLIDCEIAFPRPTAPVGSPAPDWPGRVDIACLEAYGQYARLVFWEAKRFKNPELRSAKGLPRVCGQIKKYRDYLANPKHQCRVLESYKGVVANLVALHEMGWKPQPSPHFRQSNKRI